MKFQIFFSCMLCETLLIGGNNSLLFREFIFCSSKSFQGDFSVYLLASYWKQRLYDFDTGALLMGITNGSSHISQEPSGTGTGQHFINTGKIPRVHRAFKIKSIFTCLFDHVLVGGDTGCFQEVGGNLFFLSWDHMDSLREFITNSFLTAVVIWTDFWFGNTSVITRFGIWFFFGDTKASGGSESRLVLLSL